MKVELIKIVLKNGQRMTFRRDSIVSIGYYGKTDYVKQIPLSELLEKKKFIEIQEDRGYYINISEIVYIEIYKGKSTC